jgi:3-deoxy-D-manno-octulosonate 8-phosphate phosphatase (KDO 8-P phosphatase)
LMSQTLRPVLEFPAELHLRAQEIRLAIFDVDGVLTDGGLYFDGDSNQAQESFKRFSVLDGQGFKMLRQAGIGVAVITGRDSAALRKRLAALKVQHAVFGTEDKLPEAQRLMAQLGLSWQQTAVMGDDWPDLPLLSRAQLACVPANAHAQNKALAHWVTEQQGGHGAARAMCDLILTAQGHYARLLQELSA